MNKNRIGSGPIQPELHELMNGVAYALDRTFNPDGKKKWGFVLLSFPFGSVEGRCNYISNANREDITTLLREQLSYFEGMPETPPAKGKPI